MKKKSLIIALPMMFALALTGCTKPDSAPESAPATSAPATSQATETGAPTPSATASVTTSSSATATATQEATAPQSIQAMEALNALVVAAESGSDTYERDYFNHWVSKNGTGCDTRFAVLVEESTTKAVTSGCTVVSGNWNSVYDGKTITDPKTLDIDHMVPLKEAWESGASLWDAAKRESYANDLAFADSLVAVTAASNRSKSDRDPAGYLPTDASNKCSYVSKWIAVKTRWNMTVDAQEKAAITNQLNSCGSGEQIPSVVKADPSSDVAPEPAQAAVPAAPAPVAAPPVAGTDGNDPKYTSCSAALAGGFGPYTKGEPEYDWYRDGDGDGTVCEK